jgi:hypothetical protein
MNQESESQRQDLYYEDGIELFFLFLFFSFWEKSRSPVDTAQPKNMFRDSQRGENTLDMTSRFLQERALKIARNVQHGSAAAGGARADCCGKVKWSSAHLPPLYCARPEPTKASTRREQRGLRRKCMPASFALGLHTGRVILSLSFFNSLPALPFGINCFSFFFSFF